MSSIAPGNLGGHSMTAGRLHSWPAARGVPGRWKLVAHPSPRPLGRAVPVLSLTTFPRPWVNQARAAPPPVPLSPRRRQRCARAPRYRPAQSAPTAPDRALARRVGCCGRARPALSFPQFSRPCLSGPRGGGGGKPRLCTWARRERPGAAPSLGAQVCYSLSRQLALSSGRSCFRISMGSGQGFGGGCGSTTLVASLGWGSGGR